MCNGKCELVERNNNLFIRHCLADWIQWMIYYHIIAGRTNDVFYVREDASSRENLEKLHADKSVPATSELQVTSVDVASTEKTPLDQKQTFAEAADMKVTVSINI